MAVGGILLANDVRVSMYADEQAMEANRDLSPPSGGPNPKSHIDGGRSTIKVLILLKEWAKRIKQNKIFSGKGAFSTLRPSVFC